MITLVASIAGFIGALLPELLKIFADRLDKKHELAIMDRQIAMSEKGLNTRLNEVANYADMIEAKALYTTFKSNVAWVDALNSAVRPILAYSFFGLYSVIKYFELKMVVSLADYRIIIDTLWNMEDQAIFSCIIGFYFGQRAMIRLSRSK